MNEEVSVYVQPEWHFEPQLRHVLNMDGTCTRFNEGDGFPIGALVFNTIIQRFTDGNIAVVGEIPCRVIGPVLRNRDLVVIGMDGENQGDYPSGPYGHMLECLGTLGPFSPGVVLFSRLSLLRPYS